MYILTAINMRLSDNEKRDAVKLMQDGKPLSDKYRFF